MNLQDLKSTYKLYGYKVKNENQNILICLYEEGRYYGADIIPLNKDDETIANAKLIRDEYSKSGYAANLKDYNESIDAEIELYKSFFSYASSKKRNKKKYDDFASKQSKINGGYPYQYINSPFKINNSLSKNGITISINEHLKNKKPQLIIIEAAAGYGKTCTSYELLKGFLESSSCEIPLMTELSRNRGANIFRYILLDEIDRQYPNLDSKIVKHEIQTGRIPLIIDGFDELLKKSNIVISDQIEVFNEVETMLDTIGHLLENSAKIILTTRKTAIFSGKEFNSWTKKWNGRFDITRYSIEVPRIKDWIGPNRLLSIREQNIPVEYIANPVLLTYLRNLSLPDFSSLIEKPNSIVETYFKSLMSREIERQDLKINPDDQYKIFKQTVKLLIELDISTEKQVFFKEIIYDQNKTVINEALKLYPSSTDTDDLINKLANHAILDRKGILEDQIGFINDFVFGTFIGDIMSETPTEKIDSDWSSYMVELGITAYKVQNKENKEKLWHKIESLNERFEKHSLFYFDITLRNALLRNYVESEINSLSIYNITFNAEYRISKSVFINCTFKRCVFLLNSFEDVTFLKCIFIECTAENGMKLEEMSNVKAINCEQDKSDILVFYKSFPEEKSLIEKIENKILFEIYNGQNKTNSLLKIISGEDKKVINKAFENLIENEYIEISGLNLKMSTNKISLIKKRIRE